ncbi:MAG TPA: 50S ribosomal protein L25 [Solirubrobacteraceae bacterium]|jgi:large subunit ribosomal protein L25|nr:50S ribosomal protein L25 [Solirubrobacteraceae bacterium]
MSEQSTSLLAASREPGHSRQARRLRREGLVLGTVYGGGKDPVSFQIDARILRNTLAHSSAVLDLQIDNAAAEPVVVKERVRHPVSGETMHVDLLRVDLNVSIQAQVVLELTDIDESDVKVGGVLENAIQSVTVEAKPNDIPDSIQHSIAGLEVGGTVTLGDLKAPTGVTIIGDPELTLAVIRTSRSMMAEESAEELELETEVVGEGGEGESEAAAEGDSAEASDGE